MRLRQFRSLWGMVDATDGLLARTPHHTLEALLPVLARQGYRGVEVPLKFALSLDDGGKGALFRDLLEENDLQMGSMIFTDGPAAAGEPGAFGPAIKGFKAGTAPGAAMSTAAEKRKVVDEHLVLFKEQADASREFFGDRLEFINSHSCKDYFTADMAEAFFSAALEHDGEVMHEGHRKRFLHSPWVARDFLVPNFPELRFVADLSHWTCVAETGPDDPDLTRVVEAIAPMTYHTHCRVGYDHGPQCADPRAPEVRRLPPPPSPHTHSSCNLSSVSFFSLSLFLSFFLSRGSICANEPERTNERTHTYTYTRTRTRTQTHVQWLPYTEGFELWWDKIWEAQRERGDEFTTMTPEHGPPT